MQKFLVLIWTMQPILDPCMQLRRHSTKTDLHLLQGSFAAEDSAPPVVDNLPKPQQIRKKGERMAKDDTDGHPTESEKFISIEVEDPYSPLTTSLREMLSNAPRLSPDCCILRAPMVFRQINEKAFNPSVVSIGPFHHGKEELQPMEKLKVAYLNAFLTRNNIELETLIKEIKEWENKVRNCYEETIEFSSDDFVKMILLDSCFIIEVIWREEQEHHDTSLKEDDQLSHPRILNNVMTDLILLENQLPFFVVEGLFNRAYPNSIGTSGCFTNLCVNFFGDLLISGNDDQALENLSRQQPYSDIKHLLDLLRISQAPSIPRESPEHLEELTMPKATELEEAGMVIKPGLDQTSVTDIRYTPGVLHIPILIITIFSETVLRNLIALELCLYHEESYIADYVYFMDSLIDTTKDAELLIRQGIVRSISSDSNEVATLFNNLRPYFNFPNYFYWGIPKKVNAYCEVRWHKWRASLRRDYCSSPWIIASTIAAMIFLLLTFIQTVWSIISA